MNKILRKKRDEILNKALTNLKVSEVDTLKAELTKFRTFVASEMRKQLIVTRTQDYWPPASVIERTAKFMQTVSQWDW